MFGADDSDSAGVGFQVLGDGLVIADDHDAATGFAEVHGDFVPAEQGGSHGQGDLEAAGFGDEAVGDPEHEGDGERGSVEHVDGGVECNVGEPAGEEQVGDGEDAEANAEAEDLAAAGDAEGAGDGVEEDHEAELEDALAALEFTDHVDDVILHGVGGADGDGEGDDSGDGNDPAEQDESETLEAFQGLEGNQEELANDAEAEDGLDGIEGPVGIEVDGVAEVGGEQVQDHEREKSGGRDHFEPEVGAQPEHAEQLFAGGDNEEGNAENGFKHPEEGGDTSGKMDNIMHTRLPRSYRVAPNEAARKGKLS
jgi:hypothetical protein